MIHCACLLEERQGKVLLVRVRDNALWYLPGGTIEAGEKPEDALIREIDEELGVQLIPSTIRFIRRIVGPAYGREGDVELNCFTASWIGEMAAQAELSELGWFGESDREKVAPAIRLLFDSLWKQNA